MDDSLLVQTKSVVLYLSNRIDVEYIFASLFKKVANIATFKAVVNVA